MRAHKLGKDLQPSPHVIPKYSYPNKVQLSMEQPEGPFLLVKLTSHAGRHRECTGVKGKPRETVLLHVYVSVDKATLLGMCPVYRIDWQISLSLLQGLVLNRS